jgi:1,4-dihydroxy-2-naphthoyl-CoA synthase
MGRVLSSSAAEFLFGCAGAPGSPLRLGAFVEAETGAACAIGVVADIRVVDDAFARQLVAGDAKPDYIQEQRDRRLTPLEVRALHAGYVLPGGEVLHRLPPCPPSALEAVYPCDGERVRAFLRDSRGGWNFSFLSILIAAGASNEVLAECVWQAAAAQPADPQGKFRQEAARELTRLLSVDLQRLYSLLPQLAG